MKHLFQAIRMMKAFLSKYRLLMSSIVVITVLMASFNVWYWYTKNQEIQALTRSTQEMVAKSDAQIKQIIERKAEERQKHEEAAARAAEQAALGNEEAALSINSKDCNNATSHTNPASIDVIVNKKHCIQPLGYEPPDLKTVNGATLSAKASDAYSQLYAAVASAGQGFYVTSSYRSYANQVATYNYWVSTSGQDGADTYSARPGYSEHQTGLAFDVATGSCVLDCFGSTTQYAWLQEHAADYGFIQRYYKGYESITGYRAEEWHYRYVGVPVAKDMQAKGIKTLEQYWKVSGGTY